MTLNDQALLRVDQAFVMGLDPVRWVASEAAAAELRVEPGEQLAGLPVEIGQPRSEWGLDLMFAR